MKILTIIGLAIVALILLTVAFLGIGSQDWISYTATGSEILSPAGTSMGHALVLYDPGLSGVARGAAIKVADGLKQNGYNVTLAGVRSTAAANVSGYDVIVVGGPVYMGVPSNSVMSYLKTVTLPDEVKPGIFAIGSDQSYDSDVVSVGKGVTTLWNDSHPNIKQPVIKVFGQSNVDQKSGDFVSTLLQ